MDFGILELSPMYTSQGDGKELIRLLMILTSFPRWSKISEKCHICTTTPECMDGFEPNLHISCITGKCKMIIFSDWSHCQSHSYKMLKNGLSASYFKFKPN